MPAGCDKNVSTLKLPGGLATSGQHSRQDERSLAREESQAIFEGYFRIFPWHLLPPGGEPAPTSDAARGMVDGGRTARRSFAHY